MLLGEVRKDATPTWTRPRARAGCIIKACGPLACSDLCDALMGNDAGLRSCPSAAAAPSFPLLVFCSQNSIDIGAER